MSNVVGLDGEPIERDEPVFRAKEHLDLAAHFASLANMAANGEINSYVGVAMTGRGPINFRSGLRCDTRDTFALLGLLGQMQSDMAAAIRDLGVSEDLDDGAA